MAERLVSPGVFTQENDLSFLPQGIAEIGAAFVGPTTKGPAFRPVIVESQEDYQQTFGDTSPDFYTPHAVKNYLTEAARATVVRVLGLTGYSSTVNKSLIVTVASGSKSYVAAVIHPSRVGVTIASASLNGTASPSQFTLILSGANGQTTYTSMSLNPTSTNFIANVLGTSPLTKQDGYVYASFPNGFAFVSASVTGSVSIASVSGELNFSGSTWGTYTNASTPWIKSQTLGGSKQNLFRFWTLSDGVASNKDVKISISSIRPSVTAGEYGTFTVLVRGFADTDSKTQVLEQFDNLTLDPNSTNYVARRIGDSRTVIDANNDIYLEGDWPNASKYVYIEMADGSDAVSTDALPYGFAAPHAPVNSTTVPAPDYVTTRYYIPTGTTTSVANNKVFYGFNFTSDTSLNYLMGLPSGSSQISGIDANQVADAGFDLLTTLAAADISDITPTSGLTYRKFTVPFQGGFDGENPAVLRNVGSAISSTNTQGFNLSDSTTDGSRAYNIALNALGNKDVYDINLLVLPGVVYSLHSYVATQGINLCEDRGDCFYILDAAQLGDTVSAAVNASADLDTSYAATYHPWVKIRDLGSNKTIWVPPSVVLPQVYAFNDRVGEEWFAPAGLTRGGIGSALQVRSRLDQSDRDDLYENRVNPIATFPGQGIVVWGQKTLQQQASALDRVSVRRLLITTKKFIASTSRYLVFEQNVESTRNKFLSVVNPYLASIQERNGLYAFRVKMDDTNNTPETIDRNQLVGELWLKPTKTSEYVILTFNVLPTGAVFPT